MRSLTACGLAMASLLASLAFSQGKLADYQRGHDLQVKARGIVVNAPGPMNWIGDSSYFWYYRSVRGGTEFMLADAEGATKKPAFDHERLASAINGAAGGHYTAFALPFAPAPTGRSTVAGRPTYGPDPGALTFLDNRQSIQFGVSGFLWKCTLTSYECTKGAAIPQDQANAGSRPPEDEDNSLAAPFGEGGDPADGLAYQPFPQAGSTRAPRRTQSQLPCAPRVPAELTGSGTRAANSTSTREQQVCASFDGKWEAFIQNFNVFLRTPGSTQPAIPLSMDGSEGNAYTFPSIAWSPDSKKLAAYHTRPGYDRQLHFIQSSPADQLQPKHSSMYYRKPGDTLDIAYPVLFDVEKREATAIVNSLFPNPYSLTPPVWWKDSRAFTFEYNERGHQLYRVIEVEAHTGRARALIDEQTKSFFYYNLLGPGMSGGRRFRFDVNDGKELIWASERDGWEHLYLYDGVTGKVKSQITKGNWLVRNVDYVDTEARQIWFEAGGINEKQDPYFTQYYRINFDGTDLTAFTEADGYHTVTFSADRKYYTDTWSRVDLPPVAQLRRSSDRKLILELEKADTKAMLALGLRYPEVFVAKGRDSTTDIWGIIVRPTNFDPKKKYPVIEQIYAGPHGSFVPKTFSAIHTTQALAELGFIVVQIDGMGTSNRSKAFHDVAYKNLGDAGFPDRILWHKAVAAKYPYYDIKRVGIYGTSAGGQSSLGGVLFYPEFYKVVVSNSGCHDNRMDKIWWNEQWMGWPLGPHYAAASNVENAHRLQGKALIIIPEMDSNVDPASSLQVVSALVKANKHFDMLYIPGQNHGTPVLATQHYLQDYFVHNLLGVEPPDWNKTPAPAETVSGGN